MAANLPEDERNRRVLMVGEYFISVPGATTRSTAQHFSELGIKMSNATVHNYLERYQELKTNEPVVSRLKANKGSVDDENVRKRVLYFTTLYLDKQMNMDEIAETYKISFYVVYHDLTTKIKKINQDLAVKIEEEIKKRKMQNLTKGRKK